MKGLYPVFAARMSAECAIPLSQNISEGVLIEIARERLAGRGFDPRKDPALFAVAVELQALAMRQELAVIEQETAALRIVPKRGRTPNSSEHILVLIGAFWTAHSKLCAAGQKPSTRRASSMAGKRLGVSAEKVRKAEKQFRDVGRRWGLPAAAAVDRAARIALAMMQFLDQVEQEAARQARGPKLLHS